MVAALANSVLFVAQIYILIFKVYHCFLYLSATKK